MQDVAYNKNMTQKAIFEYQKTVLEALEETEDAIASFHFEQERNQSLVMKLWLQSKWLTS